MRVVCASCDSHFYVHFSLKLQVSLLRLLLQNQLCLLWALLDQKHLLHALASHQAEEQLQTHQDVLVRVLFDVVLSVDVCVFSSSLASQLLVLLNPSSHLLFYISCTQGTHTQHTHITAHTHHN